MKLGIIGCGNMGSAIARGILSKRILPFNNVFLSDKDPGKTRVLYRKFGVCVAAPEEIAKKCSLIILAVKPQNSGKLLKSISQSLGQSAHLVSIMAGVTIGAIESFIGRKVAVTRAMPNMAALAGRSMTCLTHNKQVKSKGMVQKIFYSIGDVMEVEEGCMDGVTAITGSGPAYFFYLAECLRDAAVKLGIEKEKAAKLAALTLAGSGALLDTLALEPAVLIERIASKKGTTEAALSVLKSKNFKHLVDEAVTAAVKRSRELSKGA